MNLPEEELREQEDELKKKLKKKDKEAAKHPEPVSTREDKPEPTRPPLEKPMPAPAASETPKTDQPSHPAPPAHIPEAEDKQQSPVTTKGAPHMAEKEQYTTAQVVTVESPGGKSTIVVERKPGQAAHATVVDESPSEPIDTKQKDVSADKLPPGVEFDRRRKRRRRGRDDHSQKPSDIAARKAAPGENK